MKPDLYGLMAEFEQPEELLNAARAAHQAARDARRDHQASDRVPAGFARRVGARSGQSRHPSGSAKGDPSEGTTKLR